MEAYAKVQVERTVQHMGIIFVRISTVSLQMGQRKGMVNLGVTRILPQERQTVSDQDILDIYA